MKNQPMMLAAAAMLMTAVGAQAADYTTTATAAAPAAPTLPVARNAMYVDQNGDGVIERSEVVPGSQLEKRFATRDANADGKLTRDEYYIP